MKDEKLKEVAQKLGVAKSTVSRTVRHCSGVDAETRRRILQHTAELGINDARPCSVYSIIPDTPNYFWGVIGQVMSEEASRYGDDFLKQNLYTNLSNHDLVLRYLDEAALIRPDVLILAAEITPEVRERLALLRETMTVLLLAEYDDVPYTFYIGSDPYSDGFRMGEYFLSHFSERTPVVVGNPQNRTVALRACGFCDALKERDRERFGAIPAYEYPMEYIYCGKNQLAPSRFAALLAERIKGEEDCCLYVPFGSTALAMALQKAKFGSRVICCTHDAALNEDGIPERCITVSINQDIRVQGREAIRAAKLLVEMRMCPDRKFTYIPSTLHTAD